MKHLVLVLVILMTALPIGAQESSVVAIPPCTAEENALIPTVLIESGFFLEFALISFGPIDDEGNIDFLPSLQPMLKARDLWVEAVVPNLPNCVEGIEFELIMGDYLDQSIIQMMVSVVDANIDDSYGERADAEMARVQAFDELLGTTFDTLFADIDIEAMLQEQLAEMEDD